MRETRRRKREAYTGSTRAENGAPKDADGEADALGYAEGNTEAWARARAPKLPRVREIGTWEPGSARTFDFLGFTHGWVKARSGQWTVMRKTMRSRFTRTLQAITEWCRKHMHAPLAYQAKILGMKLRGHDAYYGIIGDHEMLSKFRHFVKRIWWKCLRRRSQRTLTGVTFYKVILARYSLPLPRVARPMSTANL